MSLLEEIGIPELTSKQVKQLSEIAEEAARKHVLGNVSSGRISALNIAVKTEGTRPITVNVDVEVTLSPIIKHYNVKKLVSEAKEKAFESVEKYLRNLVCRFTK